MSKHTTVHDCMNPPEHYLEVEPRVIEGIDPAFGNLSVLDVEVCATEYAMDPHEPVTVTLSLGEALILAYKIIGHVMRAPGFRVNSVAYPDGAEDEECIGCKTPENKQELFDQVHALVDASPDELLPMQNAIRAALGMQPRQ